MGKHDQLIHQLLLASIYSRHNSSIKRCQSCSAKWITKSIPTKGTNTRRAFKACMAACSVIRNDSPMVRPRMCLAAPCPARCKASSAPLSIPLSLDILTHLTLIMHWVKMAQTSKIFQPGLTSCPTQILSQIERLVPLGQLFCAHPRGSLPFLVYHFPTCGEHSKSWRFSHRITAQNMCLRQNPELCIIVLLICFYSKIKSNSENPYVAIC